MTARQEIKQFLDIKADRLGGARATGTGSPFGNTITSGIKRSRIKCGTHRPISALTHWRGGQYKCKEGCKK